MKSGSLTGAHTTACPLGNVMWRNRRHRRTFTHGSSKQVDGIDVPKVVVSILTLRTRVCSVMVLLAVVFKIYFLSDRLLSSSYLTMRLLRSCVVYCQVRSCWSVLRATVGFTP